MKWAWIASTVATIAITYAAYRLQFFLIYPSNFPSGSRTDVDAPDSLGLPFEDVRLKTPDGETIHLYLISKPHATNTVLMLGPNAGNIGHALPIAKLFWKNMDTNVVLLSYRGYGRSTGRPSEVGIKIDADTAMSWMATHPHLVGSNVILYGRSLGGAVATYIASKNSKQLAALIVENTFTSIPKLAPSVMPFLKPFMFLLTQKWNSEVAIQLINTDLPVLFLSGSRDELIPPSQFRQLFDKCPSKLKIWKAFPQGHHNDTIMQPGYWREVTEFIQSL